MTEMIALIQTVSQYREVLDRVTKLAEKDPDPDSPAGRELGVLSVLLQEYERKTFSLAPPNPIGAIRLRMEQLGLTPKDLVPLIGSRSKVSEVLAGKRPLSLPMIRSLHVGLGIPLESLIAEVSEGDLDSKIQWDRFPIKEMIKRQWIDVSPALKSKTLGFDVARQLMQGFLKPVGGLSAATVALHKTDRVRAGRTSDRFALTAWAAFIRRRAEQIKVYTSFNAAEWGIERVRELRSLSRFDVGPRLAIQFLLERGIVVVIERHLNRTRLDGAAMLRNDGTPVIGLTLRHDRIDNFWFTLFHELMHVLYHLKSERHTSGYAYFIDDLDVPPDAFPLEKEADEAAREALVPKIDLETSAANFVVAPATVTQLAQQVGVAEAIVAGRVRFERRNYRLLSSMVGAGQIRQLFPEVALQDQKGKEHK